jgi:hypothetical protein
MPRRGSAARAKTEQPPRDDLGIDSFVRDLDALEIDIPPDDPAKPNRTAQPRHYRDEDHREECRKVMSALMRQGIGKSDRHMLMKAKCQVGPIVADALFAELRAEWLADEAEQRALVKHAQRQRLLASIPAAAKDKQFSAVASMERILCDIEGNKAPEVVHVKADIRLSAALSAVVGELSSEEARVLLAEEVQRQLPPGPEPIEAEGESDD